MAKRDQDGDPSDQDRLQLRPVGPPGGFEEVATFGWGPEEILVRLYSTLGDWLADIKSLAERRKFDLKGILRSAWRKAKHSRRVKDATDATALKLLSERTGPELLVFFLMKCPHAGEAFLKGELPPYPWRDSAQDGGDWLTLVDAGTLLGRHRGTVGRWVRAGRLEDNGKKGPGRRVKRSDVMREKASLEMSAELKRTAEEEDRPETDEEVKALFDER